MRHRPLHQHQPARPSTPVHIGRMLVEAKGSTEHGEWLKAIDACEALPFKQRTAQRLMKVAPFEAFQDEGVYAALPPNALALETIVSCAKDKEEKLLQLVADGHITPDSRVLDIKAAFGMTIEKSTPYRFPSEDTLKKMEVDELASYAKELTDQLAKVNALRMPKAA